MSYPYIPAYHRSGGSNLPLRRIVIHATVSACQAGGARGNANYFQSPNSGGSAHYVVDPAEIVQCVPDDVIAWHAPPNQYSIGVELCDPQAGDPSRWQDDPHQSMLRLAAGLVRDLCVAYGVPEVEIFVAGLLAGEHGLCGHVDVSNAWHQSDHTDPGNGFPWTQFLQLVTGGAPSGQEDDMPIAYSQEIPADGKPHVVPVPPPGEGALPWGDIYGSIISAQGPSVIQSGVHMAGGGVWDFIGHGGSDVTISPSSRAAVKLGKGAQGIEVTVKSGPAVTVLIEAGSR